MKKIEPIRIESSLGIMFQTVNIYLVPGEQLTVIDCGMHLERNWEDFQQKIKTHGYEVSDIEQVIITHEHQDHIGLLPQIMANCDAIVRMPKMIEKWFANPEKARKEYMDFSGPFFGTLGFSKERLEQTAKFYERVRTTPKIEDLSRVHFYEEGDFLRFGNTDWEALNTPGHCPTQFVFLQKEQKRLFGSDMMLPITPMPIVTEDPIEKGKPVRALKDLLNSFERLRDFEIETVYPGHGPVFPNANFVIDKQIGRIQLRKTECFENVKSGLKTAFEIKERMYPQQATPPDFSGLYMVWGYLDLLLEERKIRKTEDENGVFLFKIN